MDLDLLPPYFGEAYCHWGAVWMVVQKKDSKNSLVQPILHFWQFGNSEYATVSRSKLTGVKRASGAWNRSVPTLMTLPSGSCHKRQLSLSFKLINIRKLQQQVCIQQHDATKDNMSPMLILQTLAESYRDTKVTQMLDCQTLSNISAYSVFLHQNGGLESQLILSFVSITAQDCNQMGMQIIPQRSILHRECK